MKDINEFLKEMIEGSATTQIISNPNTLTQLQKDGLELDKAAVLTPQEYVDKLFKEKKTIALESVKSIPSLPDVGVPTIGTLYKEIAECVLFGLNGAAISLSAVLVEYTLKLAIVKAKYGNKYNANEWDLVERIELGPAIKEAVSLNVLDNTNEQKFLDFKNKIRNPYLHYNIKKLTEGIRAKKVKQINVKTGEIKEVEWNTESDPMLWPAAKQFIDKKTLENVLGFVCYSVELLLVKK